MTSRQLELLENFVRNEVRKSLNEENSKILRKTTSNSIFLKSLGNNKFGLFINEWPICYFSFDGRKNIQFKPLTRNETQSLLVSILDNMGIGNQFFKDLNVK